MQREADVTLGSSRRRIVSCRVTSYTLVVILAFRHRGLKRFFVTDDARKLIAEHVERIRRLLTALDSARGPQNLSSITFALHALKGERKGEWAVTVRANWRITFRFVEGNVTDVDLVDYH